MNHLRSKQIARLAMILALTIGYGGSAVSANSAPGHSAKSILAQTESTFLPGFAEPSSDVIVINTAIGDLEVGEPATLVVERLRIAPGDAVPAIDGAQILQVEHGTLSYTDDLGLDAELLPDAAGFFAAGNTAPIVNELGVPVIVVRTTITGATTEPKDDDSIGNDEKSTEPEEGSSESDPDQTGERPTPTEESGFRSNDALVLVRSNTSEMKAFASATPEASPVAATPSSTETATVTATASATATPIIEPTSSATPIPSTAKLGVLLEGDLTGIPGGDQQMFAADVELQPGAQLVLTESTGPIGIIARGGDLTVERDGRAPSKLRNFGSAILPTGISATLVNEGDAPLTLQIGGISGRSASGDSDAENTATVDATPDTADEPLVADDEPVDVSGAGRFIPTDSEMENLGLVAQAGQPLESSDPEDQVLWFTDASEAQEVLEGYNWQSVTLSGYDSGSAATEFGEVAYLAINVDAFASSDDSTDFYDYLRDDYFSGGASHSRDIGNLEGVDAEMRISTYNADSDLEYGLMVIRSGEYAVTIFVNGPELNSIGIMEAVANLIFGARG